VCRLREAGVATSRTVGFLPIGKAIIRWYSRYQRMGMVASFLWAILLAGCDGSCFVAKEAFADFAE